MLSILKHHSNKSIESSQVAGAFEISAQFQSIRQNALTPKSYVSVSFLSWSVADKHLQWYKMKLRFGVEQN